MAKDFFHPDMERFIDHRFDWERYFRLSGRVGSVADEVDTFKIDPAHASARSARTSTPMLAITGTRRRGSRTEPWSCRRTSRRLREAPRRPGSSA